DAFAVVPDAEPFRATELDVNREAAAAGIDRVFDQLLDDGGRTLDHFARGDLVGEISWETGDAAHRLNCGLPCENLHHGGLGGQEVNLLGKHDCSSASSASSVVESLQILDP